MDQFAVAQINPTVGDLAGNCELILGECRNAAGTGAAAVCFPDLAVTGAPLDALDRRADFVAQAAAALHGLASQLKSAGMATTPVFLGHPDNDAPGQSIVVTLVHGQVFYGSDAAPDNISGRPVSVRTRHDYVSTPPSSSSPWQLTVVLDRLPFAGELPSQEQWADMTQPNGGRLVWVNLVGGQDEHVFAGGSFVVDADGGLAGRAQYFETDLLQVPLGGPAAGTDPIAPIAEQPDRPAAVYAAATLGLRDYIDKNGFTSVLIGLSGGIDSALVAAIAVDALGPERVAGVANPSEWSSPHSQHDAAELAERTGIQLQTVPIADTFAAFQRDLSLSGVAEENLQARIRGVIWMALANQHGHVVLACGNKSELACGYSTMYGDAVGGYAPIKDVWKTTVWQLARWRNDQAVEHGQRPPIPQNTISKPPSAELRPGQLDTDSLPDYSVLDPILDALVIRRLSAKEISAGGYDAAVVERVIAMVDRAEYKRRQYPPGPRLSARTLTGDHRLPMTNRWSERAASPHPSGNW